MAEAEETETLGTGQPVASDKNGETVQIVKPSKGRLTTPLAITAAAAAVGSSFPHGFNTGVLNAPQHGRVTIPLVIAAAVSIMSNSMPHGYNTGVLNAPQLLIKEFLNGSYASHFGHAPSAGMLNFVWAFTVSIYLVGGCGGAFSAGWFANKFGRKKSLLILHSCGFLAAILFGFCKLANSLEMMIIGRFIVGFGCGAGSGLVPMYLTEIAPVNIRGAMGVLHQFALTLGILVSQVLGMRQLLGTADLWPLLLAFTAVPPLVSAIVLPFFPDSPRYSLVNRNNEEEATAALKRFRGTDDVFLDIQEMRNEQKQQMAEPKWSLRKLLKSVPHRMPLALVCVLAVCQQLSGINVVFYYSTAVFEEAGIPTDLVQYATVATGAINVLMTGISVPLMEKSGRRPLLIIGILKMILAAVVMTIALNLQATHKWMSYLSIVCMLVFVIGFAIGLGSIPQFIGAELFKQGPRPAAMSFAGLLNWLANFAVGLAYPSIQAGTGPYSFLIFIVFLLGFGVFIWKYLPETKNKTFEEISRLFSIPSGESDDIPMDDRLPAGRNSDADAITFITEEDKAKNKSRNGGAGDANGGDTSPEGVSLLQANGPGGDVVA